MTSFCQQEGGIVGSIVQLVLMVLLLTQCNEKAIYSETYTFPDDSKDKNRAIGTLADPKNLNSNEPVDTYKPYADAPFDSYYSDVVGPDEPLGAVFLPGNIYHAPGT